MMSNANVKDYVLPAVCPVPNVNLSIFPQSPGCPGGGMAGLSGRPRQLVKL